MTAQLRGKKIYLISAAPVSKENLYKIFLSIMEYNGFILEETGSGNSQIIKIKRNIQGLMDTYPYHLQ